MAVQSVERLFVPSSIHYNQAIAIAVVGLVVNLVCAGARHRGSAPIVEPGSARLRRRAAQALINAPSFPHYSPCIAWGYTLQSAWR